MKKIIVALFTVLTFTVPVELVESYFGPKCTKLKWCLDTACPHDKSVKVAACHGTYAAHMAACKLIKIPALKKACRKIAKRNRKCCLAKAEKEYKDCLRACCRDHSPSPPESCPVLEARCATM